MPPTNDFLPFCPTDTGSNLLTEADYTAAADRTSGNKPGIASAKLNNRALRQGTYIASQLAQFLANRTLTDVLDDATPAKLLAQMNAALMPLSPVLTPYLTGTGTHRLTYIFMLGSANATVGATYTNNGKTFTVKSTIAGAALLYTTGTGAPAVSGTLTKASGTGDATITFYAVRAPLYARARLMGGGSGGSGSGTGNAGGNGQPGGDSTLGGTLLVAGGALSGGVTGSNAPAGGTPTTTGGPVGVFVSGASGQSGSYDGTTNAQAAGGSGGSSALGGGGYGGVGSSGGGIGGAGAANTGAGGGGGGAPAASTSGSGAGGGSGAYIDAVITSLVDSGYAYAVGGGGAAGTAGGSGVAGGAGGSGYVEITEYYQ